MSTALSLVHISDTAAVQLLQALTSSWAICTHLRARAGAVSQGLCSSEANQTAISCAPELGRCALTHSHGRHLSTDVSHPRIWYTYVTGHPM